MASRGTHVLRTIQNLSGGAVALDLERHMADVLAAVVQTRGKGKVTLELTVEFDEDQGGTLCVATGGKVSSKLPTPVRRPERHFVRGLEREDGLLSLSRRDPSQPTLPGMPEEEGEAEPQRRTVEVIDGQRRAAADTA